GSYPTTIPPLLHLSSSSFPPDRGFRGTCYTPSCASRLGHYLGPRRSIYPSCLGPSWPPSLALPFSGLAWFSVLCRWWLLQLLGRGYWFSVGFLTVGASLSLVHCWVSFYLFCCGSAEVLGSW